MSILLLVEHNGTLPSISTLCSIRACYQWRLPITLLVVGEGSTTVATRLRSIENIYEVLVVTNSYYHNFLPERIALLIVLLAANYSHMAAPATTFGKNIIPRVAALLDIAQISDVVEIIDTNTCKCPIYAGNAYV